MNYQINHLKELESESIFIMREVAAQFENAHVLNVRSAFQTALLYSQLDLCINVGQASA